MNLKIFFSLSLISSFIALVLFILMANNQRYNSYENQEKYKETIKSFLNDTDCVHLCWYGLQPGETSPEDFFKLVNKEQSERPSFQVDCVSILEFQICDWVEPQYSVSVAMREKVEIVDIFVENQASLYPLYKYSLGDPSHFLARKVILTRGRISSHFNLVYLEQGLMVGFANYSINEEGKAEITPDLLAIRFTFFEPNNFSVFENDYWSRGETVHQWAGYGFIKFDDETSFIK